MVQVCKKLFKFGNLRPQVLDLFGWTLALARLGAVYGDQSLLCRDFRLAVSKLAREAESD